MLYFVAKAGNCCDSLYGESTLKYITTWKNPNVYTSKLFVEFCIATYFEKERKLPMKSFTHKPGLQVCGFFMSEYTDIVVY